MYFLNSENKDTKNTNTFDKKSAFFFDFFCGRKGGGEAPSERQQGTIHTAAGKTTTAGGAARGRGTAATPQPTSATVGATTGRKAAGGTDQRHRTRGDTDQAPRARGQAGGSSKRAGGTDQRHRPEDPTPEGGTAAQRADPPRKHKDAQSLNTKRHLRFRSVTRAAGDSTGGQRRRGDQLGYKGRIKGAPTTRLCRTHGLRLIAPAARPITGGRKPMEFVILSVGYHRR